MLIFKAKRKKFTINCHPLSKSCIRMFFSIYCPLVMVNSWHGDSSAIRGTKVPLPSPCMSSSIEYVISLKCPVIPGPLPGKQSTVILVEAVAATAGLQLCYSEYYLGRYEKYTLLSPGIHRGCIQNRTVIKVFRYSEPLKRPGICLLFPRILEIKSKFPQAQCIMTAV